MKFKKGFDGDWTNGSTWICGSGIERHADLPEGCTEFWVRFRKRPTEDSWPISFDEDGDALVGGEELGVRAEAIVRKKYSEGYRHVTLEVLA